MTTQRVCALLAAAITLTSGQVRISAQGPASTHLTRTFEVASIRENPGPYHVLHGYSSSGPRLTLEAYDAWGLVTEAYGLKNYQVSFAAAASRPDGYYNITARAEGDGTPTKNEFMEMLQTLLAERFRLKFHREMKEMPVYALVVAKGGPKFRDSPPDAPFVSNHGVNGRNQNLTLSQATMDALADDIRGSIFSDRPVLDKTGLTGKYDIKLEATPEFRMNNNPQPEDIGIFDAVQRQLGLKLEPQKANIEILVVDHMEKPSPN